MLEDSEAHAYSADHVAEMVHCLFDKRVVFHSEDSVAPGVSVHAWLATRWVFRPCVCH